MKLCSFSGCVGKVLSRGLCGAHYQHQRQGKELKPLQQQFHGLSEFDRFMKWVGKQPNGCWKWLGGTFEGGGGYRYGQWRNSAGIHETTHRASWRLHYGEFPKESCVLHRCDVPLCVNPDHLFLGSQADNMRDMWDKGRARPGVSRGEDHGCSKLTDEIVREIRSSGEKGTVIAKRLGVSTTTIYDVRNEKIWSHIE